MSTTSSITLSCNDHDSDDCVTSACCYQDLIVTNDKKLKHQIMSTVIKSFNTVRQHLSCIDCIKAREIKFHTMMLLIKYPQHLIPEVYDLMCLCDLKYGQTALFQDFEPSDQMDVLEIWGNLHIL